MREENLLWSLILASIAIDAPAFAQDQGYFQLAGYCAPGPTYNSCISLQQQQEVIQRQQQEAIQRQQQEAIQRQQQEAIQRQQQEAIQRQQQEAIQRQQQEAAQRQQQEAAQRQQQQAIQRQKQEAAQRQQQEQIQRQQQLREQANGSQPHHVDPPSPPLMRQSPTEPDARPRPATSRSDAGPAPRGATGEDLPMPQRKAQPAASHERAAETPRVSTEPLKSASLHQTFEIGTGTTFAPHADHHGFTIDKTTTDGSHVVVSSQALANGHQRVTAYLQSRDPAAGTRTLTYLDGHRITFGSDFTTRSAPRQLTVTTHRDGLRDVSLPNGAPVFRERFGTFSWREGRTERVVVRTVTDRIVGGTVVTLGVPVDQIYGIVPFRGVMIYPYVPVAFATPLYDFVFTPFGTPLIVVPFSPWCPPPVIAFATPVVTYADPIDLLGDLVIATAVQDGEAGPLPAVFQPPPDPAVAELSNAVIGLQQQVQTAAATNDDLRAQLADQQSQIGALQQQASAPSAAAPPPMKVSDDIRQQVHQEVRQDIALHQQQKPLSLADVMASAEAQKYVFQVGDPIDATDEAQGGECTLTTGDLTKFERLPADNEVAAHMRVVTSKDGSCTAGTVVEVSLADLQGMLNAFSLRLEDNMKKVHQQIAATQSGGDGN